MKFFQSNKTLFIILLAFGFLLSFVVNSVGYLRSISSEREKIEQKLMIAAYALKHILPEDYHKRVQNEFSISEREQKELTKNINKLVTELKIENLYSFKKINGSYYLSSGNYKHKDRTGDLPYKYFSEYKDISGTIENLKGKESPYFFEHKDKWGEYYSILLEENLENGGKYYIAANMTNERIFLRKLKFFNLFMLAGAISTFIYIWFIYDLLYSKKLKNFLGSKKSRFVVIFLFVLFIGVVSYLGNFYYNYKIQEQQNFVDDYLTSIAHCLKYILPSDYQDRAVSKEGIPLKEYKEHVLKLNSFVNHVPASSVYAIVEIDGKLKFSITNDFKDDTKQKLFSSFLESYDPKEESVLEQIKHSKLFYYWKDTTGGEGFRAALVPAKSSQNFKYTLGVDSQKTDIQKYYNSYLKSTILYSAIFTVYFFLFFLLLIVNIYFAFIKLINNQLFISLKLKFLIYFGGTAFICFFGISYIFGNYSRTLLENKTIETCRNIAFNIANIAREDLILDSSFDSTRTGIDDIFAAGMLGLQNVYILDAFGKYVVDYSEEKLGQFALQDEIDYARVINDLDLQYSVDSRSNSTILKIAYPIYTFYEDQKIKIGVAIFEYNRDLLYQPIYEIENRINWIGIGFIVLTLIATFFISVKTTNPISRLTNGVKIISEGNLNYLIDVETRDEVGILSENFNIMTERIKDYTNNLEKMVTERTEELFRSRARLQKVLTNSPVILFLISKEGKILFSDGKGLLQFGLKETQAIGYSVFELFSEMEKLHANFNHIIANGSEFKTELKIESLNFEVNLIPMSDKTGEITEVLGVFIDITERKKAEEVIQLEKEKSDRLLLNILPSKIAEELKEKGEVKPVSFESASILFTDFKGFTRIASKRSPEKLLDDLNAMFLQFDQICERRGIEKLKTIGDSFMCAGGLPIRNNTHPVDICLTALEMTYFMNEAKAIVEVVSEEEFWSMRVGIHTGSVVAGVIGKSKFSYDIWGDAVNIASRMESNCEVGRINISVDTYLLVKDYFECEYRGKLAVKNRGEIEMYFLNRIKPEFSKDSKGMAPSESFLKLLDEKR